MAVDAKCHWEIGALSSYLGTPYAYLGTPYGFPGSVVIPGRPGNKKGRGNFLLSGSAAGTAAGRATHTGLGISLHLGWAAAEAPP